MMYEVEKVLLDAKPEVRVGDKVYLVDNRMSTFVKMNRELAEAKTELSEFDIILECGLGREAAGEIGTMDLSFAAMQRIVLLVMAAMQGVSEEEAMRRFRTNEEK